MRQILHFFEKPKNPVNVDSVKLGIASPRSISQDWTFGEVKKPETINYRTFKPERDGLFCGRIFGPVKDYECICGKYKRLKHRGVVCEKCGVEVIESKVRRERMGHIDLATPVAHIWFLKSLPSRIGHLLNMTLKDLEYVLYCAKYVTLGSMKIQVERGKAGIFPYYFPREAKSDLFDDFEALAESADPSRIIKRHSRSLDRGVLVNEEDYYEVQHGMVIERVDPEIDTQWLPEVGPLLPGRILSGEEHEYVCDLLGELALFCAPATDYVKLQMGGEAVLELLAYLDPTRIPTEKPRWPGDGDDAETLDDLAVSLREQIHIWEDKVEGLIKPTGQAKIKKISKRLKIIEDLRASGNKPQHLVLTTVPVLPPDLRPLVPLDGGRFATSDLNDLYRRVINRNNRLKRLLELHAPEIIVRNEKRMLQEAVDALFDNGRRGKVITGPNKRPLKSLSDMLKGKQGRFRQNLLGKRVDYSGRSVIVVGPELRLHQCGLPKKMALELFKPFVYSKLEEQGYVTTIKSAKKLVEKETPVVWDILADVIKEHPVLLNRAPTLHRLGMQAFEPVLIEGKAIRLHPLVCTAFNADFDGDQMAVHLPLSLEAQMEARVLMMSTNNILSPAYGKPIINPTQDIVLGLYYRTRELPYAQGEGRLFASPAEVRAAFDAQAIALQARIRCRVDAWDDGQDPDEEPPARREIVETTVGRALLSEIVPSGVPFELYNKELGKKQLQQLIDEVYRRFGSKKTVLLADALRTAGYSSATVAGVSICIDDMAIPGSKTEIIEDAQNQVADIMTQYHEGLITDGERYNKVVDTWSDATETIAKTMMDGISSATFAPGSGHMGAQGKVKGPNETTKSFNNIFMMADSGARGSAQQMRQLAGMRGLMAKPSGEIIETPITANFREGLSVQQYFISTHGARKGLADTALKTANSGYLTRRLVDVANDAVITEYDCGTLDGIEIEALEEAGEVIQPLSERLLGRVALEDIEDADENILVESDTLIDEETAQMIEDAGVRKVMIRTVLTCRSQTGVCVLCYGRDLARGRVVNIGEAVGVIAAQSIGEPGTQLTMRTFHVGGAASTSRDLPQHRATVDGVVKFKDLPTVDPGDGGGHIVIARGHLLITIPGVPEDRCPAFAVQAGARVRVADGQKIKKNELLAEWDSSFKPILTHVGGTVKLLDIIDNVTVKEQLDEATGLSQRFIIDVKDPNIRPRVGIVSPDGEIVRVERTGALAEYNLPVGANLIVMEGKVVKPGDTLAKLAQEALKTKDITGGLPRVAELFEARKPKDHAVMSEVDGIVSFGKPVKGKSRILVTPEYGQQREYLIGKGKHITVNEGDRVRAGDALMDGPRNPHDILHVLGIEALAKYLVDEIQQVYRLQGVRINDKHIEVVVRQMLRWVRVTKTGDTNFMVDQQVVKHRFDEENQRVMREGGKPASGEPLLLGITKASLSTESFLSASSFQETTKVLTEACLAGRQDSLRGLKENVLMGRLIPAGTGLSGYKELDIDVGVESLFGDEVSYEGIG
ncbi:MAG: DNA-directed RNA polymerase subunit beta' [Myxococcales bacterium]|nr:DNA-directed RNA polymerase subunit beta' [Myxococcales bacterium]